ncbi:hypothetical protein D0Y65_020599 [Glycine soja]|uniref:Uncharacterized protein n=1 Tax=Glycine soja TaxID=3848 RepID=A0A445JEU6_GLYSO|nr:hypothetical protein D0Y65_020599 [Glycine soja]RZB96977.1 hypothetical protein D0Y65_020599 [Glycine soja]RZB96978.1 hypothetical protein D0Y65_020599 [Glycine soja]
MPLDPAAAATTTTSRPISPLPQPQMQQHHHHYPSQQQTLPIRAPNPHFVYPFAPKGVRAADQGPFPPPSMMHGGVPLDYFSHALHVARPPTHVPFSHAAAAAPAASPPVKKSAARSAVAHVNGGKDTNTREKSREDTYIVVRDRKVRITEDASLYALCRSWLRNGINEESQTFYGELKFHVLAPIPKWVGCVLAFDYFQANNEMLVSPPMPLSQQKDVMKALPKPLPASMVASYLSNKKEDEKDEDEKEENEQSVEHLSPQDLLKRHIKRAKKVRACLREERLQRITRYRSRLRLLLPPAIEQCRNDTAAGN